MTDVAAAHGARGPELPPAFTLVRIPGGAGAFAQACRTAGRDGAGTFVWSPGEEVHEFAVVLEPDEPLGTARCAFFVAMAAMVDALGAIAPPDKPLRIDWPATIRFDGARLGGGRLGWPEGCGEADIPDWLVFSGALIATKGRNREPGFTPESTSLEEEGFDPDDRDKFPEAFARHLLRGFAVWQEDGFEAAAASCLARLSGQPPGFGSMLRDGSPFGSELAAALRAPAWLDPGTGMPRL